MQDPEIAAEVMLPLKLQGIAEITENAVVARFKFTARPVKPSWVQREYLKRMYQVFAEKGITFASGALTLQTAPHQPVAGRGETSGAVVPPAEALPKSEPQEVRAPVLAAARHRLSRLHRHAERLRLALFVLDPSASWLDISATEGRPAAEFGGRFSQVDPKQKR